MSTEFANAALGDARLSGRLQTIANAAADAPDKGFPLQAGSSAALEATYRFLNNPKVRPEDILEPHYACTAGRAEEAGLVLAVHDSSELEFDSESLGDEVGWLTPSKRGFLGHFALAVSAEGLRRPLGLLGIETCFRPPFPKGPVLDKAEKKKAKKKKGNGTDFNGESRRWIDLALESSARLVGRADVIHVMDREGDSYALLASLSEAGQRFVIRLNYDRVICSDELPNGKAHLFSVLNREVGVIERLVKVLKRQRRSAPPKSLKEHPNREERMARLLFSAATATITRPAARSSKLPKTLNLNFVRVWEPDPPEGEEPIEWRLVTTEPISTVQEIACAVDWYGLAGSSTFTTHDAPPVTVSLTLARLVL